VPKKKAGFPRENLLQDRQAPLAPELDGLFI